MRLANIFHILVRLTVTDCCRIATVTVMADKIDRLTDIRAKNARLCGYLTPKNGPTGLLLKQPNASCGNELLRISEHFFRVLINDNFLKAS